MTERERLERLAQEAEARGWHDQAVTYREQAAQAGGTSAAALAARQRQAALALGAQDHSQAPLWPWPSVQKLIGSLLAGALIVIGARPGAGKTTFLLNLVEHFARLGIRWLYLGQELAPAQLRRKWAALRLGYPAAPVLRNEWHELPPNAREAVDADVMAQTSPPLVNIAHFGDHRRLDVMALQKWVSFAATEGCRVVVLDHIHRLLFGTDAAALTYETAEAVRTCKELAVKHGVVFLVAAQLNRAERDVLADYLPPPVSSLKQTGALEEEADTALLLHRAVKRGATVKELKEVRQGQRSVADVADSNVMAVRVGKHRDDGAAVDKTVRLNVDPTGRLTERAPEWRDRQVETVEDRYGI
jgi:KaiC/GvpD/RAD55 family RecA-like ATPase